MTVGTHICEMALWIDWTTLGRLEASASSELLCVVTESVIHVLAFPKREAIAEFAVEFCAKLCQAIDAVQLHMTVSQLAWTFTLLLPA